MTSTFPAYVIRNDENEQILAATESLRFDDLPGGEVLIHVAYSSLNYKDALACRGHGGVVRAFPHVPGIDCAGVVAGSESDAFSEGDAVLVTGYEFGSGRWGGYSEYVRVPAEWVVPMPNGLTAREAMTFGTAGFTAAQSVAAILDHGITAADGDVVVSGASGGVGSLAIAILAKLGFRVVASTGKQNAADFLRRIGASEVIERDTLSDTSNRPLLSAKWSAAVDTVGGATLETILRSAKHRACVTACGLVGGDQLALSVYPFILRGVTLAGIDSANCPSARRLEIWRRLAGEWKPSGLDSLVTTVNLTELPSAIDAILAGKVVGRTLVTPTVD